MLHILLAILKIIGIIITAIVGILLLTLLTVLVVPLRYKIKADFNGKWKESEVDVRFSWLLHLAAGKICWQNEKLSMKVRILWKNLSDETNKEIINNTSEQEIEDEPAKKKTEKSHSKTEESRESVQEKQREKETSEESKIKGIKCTIKKFCDTMKVVYEFMKHETHINAFSKIKKEFQVLLIALKPKRISGKVRFGFEDPYQTGQVLAVLSILYPFYAEQIEIYPEFDNEVLDGNLYVKGHIRGIHFLKMIIQIIIDKNVRATLGDLKVFMKSQ